MLIFNESDTIKIVGAILPALIAAFLGSWIGALTALSRFKKERAFDRRLQWYERMNLCLLDAARELAIAATMERGIKDGTDSTDDALVAWQRVQLKHLEVNHLTAQGALYAEKEFFRTLWKDTGVLQDLADKTNAFYSLAGPNLGKVDEVKERLRLTATALAEDVRKQLGIDPLGKHPRDEST